ncbi:MAG: MerR family transcriptional regulator [Bacteroidaceae bacterium]|nr:MerR family transcriptional regulator [Bacteroidaceae bacterium]
MNGRLTIGEFSRFCKVTIKTLRHYERMRLLVPNEVDEWTRYRYYTVSQMQQLNAILQLKEMGFSLEEVRELQDEGTSCPNVHQLENKISQTEELLDSLHDRLELLKRMAVTQSKMEAMERISIQRLPEIIVAVHHHVLDRWEDLPSVCAGTMGPELQRLGCKRSLPINWFIVEHDKGIKGKNIDIDIFEQVEDLMLDTSVLKFRILPEVPTAVCMKCQGPHNHFTEQFAELQDYIKEHEFQVSGPRRIRFVKSMWNQKNPEKWLSVIQVPVTRDKRPRLAKRLFK